MVSCKFSLKPIQWIIKPLPCAEASPLVPNPSSPLNPRCQPRRASRDSLKLSAWLPGKMPRVQRRKKTLCQSIGKSPIFGENRWLLFRENDICFFFPGISMLLKINLLVSTFRFKCHEISPILSPYCLPKVIAGRDCKGEKSWNITCSKRRCFCSAQSLFGGDAEIFTKEEKISSPEWCRYLPSGK